MNAHRYFRYCLLASLLVAAVSASAQAPDGDPFESRNTYRFASHLLKEGEYLRAAIEFQRYVYSTSTPPADLDSVLYNIGLCYRLASKPMAAINYFRKIPNECPDSPLVEESYFQTAFSYLLADRGRESMTYIENHMPLVRDEERRLKIQGLIGLNHLKNRRWDAAAVHLDSIGKQAPNDPVLTSMTALAHEGRNLPSRNRALAGLYSTVIPGTGKMYCGRPIDGVFSLLTIGLSAWQAYDGFSKDGVSSVRGWLYGSIGGFFYVGNIYGSVVAAQIFNEEQQEGLSKKVEELINAQSH